ASSQTAAATATTPTEQPDLSGTYAGVMNCPDAGVTGDTTLTVTGNQFTLSNGPSGRIVASTTQGYTAVVMQFGEAPTAVAGQPPPAPPKIVSFRGKKSGNRLTLSPVAGGSQCSFTPSSGMARSRGGRGNRRAAQPAAAGEATSNPAAAPTVVEPTAGPMPAPAKPARAKGRS